MIISIAPNVFMDIFSFRKNQERNGTNTYPNDSKIAISLSSIP